MINFLNMIASKTKQICFFFLFFRNQFDSRIMYCKPRWNRRTEKYYYWITLFSFSFCFEWSFVVAWLLAILSLNRFRRPLNQREIYSLSCALDAFLSTNKIYTRMCWRKEFFFANFFIFFRTLTCKISRFISSNTQHRRIKCDKETLSLSVQSKKLFTNERKECVRRRNGRASVSLKRSFRGIGEHIFSLCEWRLCMRMRFHHHLNEKERELKMDEKRMDLNAMAL